MGLLEVIERQHRKFNRAPIGPIGAHVVCDRENSLYISEVYLVLLDVRENSSYISEVYLVLLFFPELTS